MPVDRVSGRCDGVARSTSSDVAKGCERKGGRGGALTVGVEDEDRVDHGEWPVADEEREWPVQDIGRW